MKKNFILITGLFLFSLWIMFPSLIQPYYKGHDTNFHVANIDSLAEKISFSDPFYKAPLPNISDDFGYGTRFFYPPLPHLFAAYATKTCGNVLVGMRFVQFLSFFASGIAFYFLGCKLFTRKLFAFLASCFYMAGPYHLSDIFIRDAFSEMFIFVSFPLIILGLLSLVEENYPKFFLIFILGYTLSIFSHLAMTIYGTILLLVTFFPIYYRKIFTKKHILYLFFSTVIVLLLTSTFWIPLLEHKLSESYAIFIPYYITAKGDLRFSAINPMIYFQLFLPHTYDFIRYHLHLSLTVIVLLMFFRFFKEKMGKEKNRCFAVSFTIFSILMTSPIFPWYFTPDLLQTLQFPWRLCLYVLFGACLILGFFLEDFQKKRYFLPVLGILFASVFFGSFYYTYHVSDETVHLDSVDYHLGMGNQEEYLPERIVRNRDYLDTRSKEILIISGDGVINQTSNHFPEIDFSVSTDSSLVIELPRIYYLGYRLENEEGEVPLRISENGFLASEVESGSYKLTYVGTKGYVFAKIATVCTLIFILATVVLMKLRLFTFRF